MPSSAEQYAIILNLLSEIHKDQGSLVESFKDHTKADADWMSKHAEFHVGHMKVHSDQAVEDEHRITSLENKITARTGWGIVGVVIAGAVSFLTGGIVKL